MISTLSLACLLLPLQTTSPADREVRLPRHPSLSPDGSTLAFAWQQDIWTAPALGGEARRLTLHGANDSEPEFSPDGKRIAFVSDRSGGSQVHVMALDGSGERQVTFDSNRKSLCGFTPDGEHLVVTQSTDRGFHGSESTRVFVIDLAGKAPKRMLLDAGVRHCDLSPDGKKLLFTRGRSAWERKGYIGPQAEQLWIADLSADPVTVERLCEDRPGFQNVGHIMPFWAPDGRSYYYVSDPDGTFDVYRRSLEGGAAERITHVGKDDKSDDGVTYPTLSANGRSLVFRRRFDLQHLDLSSGKVTPLRFTAAGDSVASCLERAVETSADSVAFTADGKQMAFVAGEDVWVMDRILREPRRVTSTPHQEGSLTFNADGSKLFFVSDAGGEVDIWEATHSREDGIWWLADSFALRQITDDPAIESDLRLSPTGEHIGFQKHSDLWVMDSSGTDHRRVVSTWSGVEFDWAPDGKWLVYATEDSDYNSDVFITRLDGTLEPFNVSRHPDSDGSPVWSGDGKRLAFVSMRDGEEPDVYWVALTKEEAERTSRDRKLEEALEAMKKGKSRGAKPGAAGADEPGAAAPPARRRSGEEGEAAAGDGATSADGEQAVVQGPTRPARGADEPAKEGSAKDGEEEREPKPPADVTVDFDGLFERIERISIPNSRESGLIWSPDGKTLAFNATVDNERGFFKVEFPEVGRPTKLAASGVSSARWLPETKEIVGLARGGGAAPASPFGGGRGGGGASSSPAALDAKGKLETFAFSVRREKDWSVVRQISFDQGWRAMRDRFYDGALNHRDWKAIRAKYRPIAALCLGAEEFSELMNMMLGELNASHMGHRGGSDPLPQFVERNTWTPSTYHLGVRFAAPPAGTPGMLVESVIPGSPASLARSRIEVGETVRSIDGQEVGPDVDIDRLLTLDDAREVAVEVAGADGTVRRVTIMPVRSVSGLLYDEWVEGNRDRVEELSGGKLGYLHIRGMDFPSFRQMEEDLYHAGYGKDGLIIDVRFNGGGSTTDHVMTALTQPVHAITQSRGSGEGYPQDRKVYATWSKPIVMMCNEHSFSNAEIVSHAVKQAGRGRLVGMRTAGGVISTGSVGLLDGSSVRMPGRGWYLSSSGEDMELNGCMPDVALWNSPLGPDEQLAAAVAALAEDVATANANGRVKIVPATERRRTPSR